MRVKSAVVIVPLCAYHYHVAASFQKLLITFALDTMCYAFHLRASAWVYSKELV